MAYTVFDNVKIRGEMNVEGVLLGALKNVAISSEADITLTAEQKKCAVVSVTMSAASKAVTIGGADGQVLFVRNAGDTNAFTIKGKSGDTGSSIAAGKVALVIVSTTANATSVIVLN